MEAIFGTHHVHVRENQAVHNNIVLIFEHEFTEIDARIPKKGEHAFISSGTGFFSAYCFAETFIHRNLTTNYIQV